jgi:hypothetical protein
MACEGGVATLIDEAVLLNCVFCNSLFQLVGTTGFEPATPCPPDKHRVLYILIINYLQNSPSSNLLQIHYTLCQYNYSVVTNLLHAITHGYL